MSKINVTDLLSKYRIDEIVKLIADGLIQGNSPILSYIQKIIIRRSLHMKLPAFLTEPNNVRVLVICCYMPDRPNLIEGLLNAVKEAKLVKIDFVVTNNTTAPPIGALKPYVKYTLPQASKFVAIQKIITEQFNSNHDYILVVDDDVKLPAGFFDKYFRIAKSLGLILSQPSLATDSFATYPFCLQINNAIAHLVSFVEIGPVTCFDKRIVHLLPLKSDSPMGWGLDYVWARICRDKRWAMGVVDLTPVEHRLRGVAKYYLRKDETRLMVEYLSKTPHAPFSVPAVVGQIVFKSQYLDQ